MIMKIMSYVILFLFIVGCRSDPHDREVKTLYDEVIRIHDEVMPEISTINKLRRKIKKQESQDSISQSLITRLQQADDGMMDWMSDFQVYKSYKDSTKESKLKYLESEKIKITKVSDDMYASIKSAKEFLNEN